MSVFKLYPPIWVVILLSGLQLLLINKQPITKITCIHSLEDDIKFSTNLLNLINGTSKSTVFSPISILSGLTIILAAARGETADQISAILGKGGDAKNYETCRNWGISFQENQPPKLCIVLQNR